MSWFQWITWSSADALDTIHWKHSPSVFSYYLYHNFTLDVKRKNCSLVEIGLIYSSFQRIFPLARFHQVLLPCTQGTTGNTNPQVLLWLVYLLYITIENAACFRDDSVCLFYGSLYLDILFSTMCVDKLDPSSVY